MKFKSFGKLNSKKLLNLGAILFLIGSFPSILFKNNGLAILFNFVSFLGVIFLILGAIKLKKEKEQLGETFTGEWLGEKEQGGERNKIKIMIVGLITALVWIGFNQWTGWYENKKSIEQCEKECCAYNTTDSLWEYTCDMSQCCAIFLGEKSSPECCMGFSTQKQCIDYCATDLKKTFSPKTPWWLKWF